MAQRKQAARSRIERDVRRVRSSAEDRGGEGLAHLVMQRHRSPAPGERALVIYVTAEQERALRAGAARRRLPLSKWLLTLGLEDARRD